MYPCRKSCHFGGMALPPGGRDYRACRSTMRIEAEASEEEWDL